MVDRQLGDAVTPVVGEHRDEPMQLAVEPQALDDLGAICLQTAVEIVQAEPGDATRHPVEDAGQGAARDRVAAMRFPARDEVEALVELCE